MRHTWGAIGFGVVVVALTAAGLDPRARVLLEHAAAWLRHSGPLGPAVYALGYATMVSLGAPMTWSAAIGGYLYGAVYGAALSWPASVLGSTGAFLLGRWLWHDPAEKLHQRRRWAAVDHAVSSGGVPVVALLRMAPFAQNVLSVALGATDLGLRDYVLGTIIGVAGHIAVFSWAGSLASSPRDALTAYEHLGAWAWVGLALGLGALALASAWIARRARALLKAGESPRTSSPPAPR